MATAVAAIYFVSMGWGVKGHFTSPGFLPAGMKATTVVTAAAFLWFLAGRWEVHSARRPALPWTDAAATVLILASLALFWWAVVATRRPRLAVAFSPGLPSFVLTGGPYGWVRHPFYTSYLMFWTAAALESPWPAFWLVPLAALLVYGALALSEEARFASSPLAPAYARYRRRTGMMLPRPRFRRPPRVVE